MKNGADYRERRFTAQDGLSLYFRDYGDPTSPAPPLLCLPGLVRNSKDFHDFASRHAPSRRIVCPDYRGRGRSAYDSDWRNYNPGTYIRDIGDLLTAAELHRVVFVGTSLGGLLTMALAVVRPNAFAGAVLNDIGPDIDGSGLDRIVAYITAHKPQPDWPAAVATLRNNFKNLSLKTDEEWHNMARQTYREEPDGTLRYDFDKGIGRALADGSGDIPDLWPPFRALRRIPTLAIRGGVSDVLSQETFDRMAVEKPDLKRVTVPGVGHVPFLHEPECVSAIDDFLASL